MKHVRGCPLFTQATQRPLDRPPDCRCSGPTPGTQTARIIAYLREHPGSSVMEVRFALFISNVTGRMSDARANGVNFAKWRDDKGVYRYRVVEEPVQLQLGVA